MPQGQIEKTFSFYFPEVLEDCYACSNFPNVGLPPVSINKHDLNFFTSYTTVKISDLATDVNFKNVYTRNLYILLHYKHFYYKYTINQSFLSNFSGTSTLLAQARYSHPFRCRILLTESVYLKHIAVDILSAKTLK